MARREITAFHAMAASVTSDRQGQTVRIHRVEPLICAGPVSCMSATILGSAPLDLQQFHAASLGSALNTKESYIPALFRHNCIDGYAIWPWSIT